eukprot:5166459-Prymnesium_polylepis.2
MATVGTGRTEAGREVGRGRTRLGTAVGGHSFRPAPGTVTVGHSRRCEQSPPWYRSGLSVHSGRRVSALGPHALLEYLCLVRTALCCASGRAVVCRKGGGGSLYCATVAGITLIPWHRLRALRGVRSA